MPPIWIARFLRIPLWGMAFLLLWTDGFAALTQVTEPFTQTTAPNWTFGGVNFTPILTAGPPVNDGAGLGWLRMTDTAAVAEATFARYNTTVSSANASMFVAFDSAQWGGSGADGTTFFLYDGSVPFAVGASGGSMGYAQKTIAGGGGANTPGLAGGYVGITLDNFGNFSNPTEGRVGGPGFRPNSISLRGPGSGLSGYTFIAGTGDGVNPGLNPATQFLDFPNPPTTTRPVPGTPANARHAEIFISPTGQVIVSLKFGTGLLQTVFVGDISGYTRPATMGFGFTSGTGGSNDFHELQNFNFISSTAQLWNHASSPLDNLWGTSANWVGNQLPVCNPNILFDNSFVSAAQTVDLGGVARTVHTVTFDAPFSYTLINGTLNFDPATGSGPLMLNASQGTGSAAHTVSASINMAGDLIVDNTSGNTLTLSGGVNNGGKVLTFAGTSQTTVSGVISNTGSLLKLGMGTVTLSGANTYSGGTTLTQGTLALGNGSALGTGPLTINAGALQASGGAQTINNTTTLQGNVTISGANALTFSGPWTQSGGNRTITVSNTAATTWSGNMTLSESAVARTLTMYVGSGGATVNGVIQNGGAGVDSFTKSGTGTLTLGAVNTYTGTTTVNGGTLAIAANNAIATASPLTLNGGTFNLGGLFSTRVGNLSYNNGMIDFGATGTANFMMFNGPGASANSLMIRNWETGVTNDRLAYLSVNGPLAAGFLGGIYFSGFGAEVTESAINQTIPGYGAVWTFLAPDLTVGAATNIPWNGGSLVDSNISTAANWVGGVAPVSGTTLKMSFDGNVRAGPLNGPVLDAAINLNMLRFNATAAAFTITGPIGIGNNFIFDGTTSTPSLIQMSPNNQTISTDVTFQANTIIDTIGAGNLTLDTGVIDDAATVSGFIKYGTGGKLILAGNNTYTGNNVINQGVVNIQNNNALGTGTTTVNLGGALEVQGAITVPNALTLSGTGVAAGGALRSISGNNTINGAITLADDTRINSDLNTLTIAGGIGGAGRNLTVGGAGNTTVNTVIATGAGTLDKDGAGTLTLTAANTYTGLTTIHNGTLILNRPGGGAIAGSLTISDGSIAATGQMNAANELAATSIVTVNNLGTFNLNNFNQAIGGLNSSSAAATVSLGSAALTINSSISSVYAGVISGTGSLVKQGANTLTLSGANTYTGVTTISVGTVNIQNATALGTAAGATTVAAGAGLQMQAGITVAGEPLTLNGTGVGNTGALRNISGNNAWNGAITLGSASRINSDAATLTVGGNITGAAQNMTIGGLGNVTVNGVIGTTTGAFTVDGTGTVTLGAANTYTGTTTVTSGNLAISASDRIANTSALVLGSGATFSLGGSFSQRFDTLSYNNSTIDFGAPGTANFFMFNGQGAAPVGTLTIANWENGTDIIAKTSASPALSAAFLQNMYFEGFGAGAQVNPPPNQTIPGYGALWSSITPTLNLSTWSGGGVDNFWSTAGNWVGNVAPVSGNTLKVTFTGNTRLTPDMNANYTANTLKFDAAAGAFTLGSSTASTLTMNGIRPSIINLSANNQIVNQALTLAATTEVVTTGAGTLTLNGVVSGVGGIIKRGSSTVVLTGNNTYAGGTTINVGVVNIQNNNALGGNAVGTTVAAGAALQMQGNIAVGAQPLTLNGAGIGNTGSIRSISGNNSWAGGIVLNSQNIFLGVDAGQLNITGVISGPCSSDFTKVGAGKLILSAANTVGGQLNINGGTVEAAVTGALQNIDAITVNAAGTLLLTGPSIDRIADTATITMNGGVLTAQDATETMGALTFAVNSTINLGTVAGTENLTFSNAFAGGGATLTINNWLGSPGISGTDDRIFFSINPGAAVLSQIQFTGFTKGAYRLGSGEIVPVPEPGTWAAGLLLASLLIGSAFRFRRPMAVEA